MNENLPNNINWPDFKQLFAPLIEVQIKMQELIAPMQDMFAKMNEIMRPLADYMATIKVNFDGISTAFLNASRTMEAIRRLGDEQFVYWEFLSREFIDRIVDAEDVGIELEKVYITENNNATVTLLDQLQNHPMMERHKALMEQAVCSAEHGCYDLAVIGLTAIFDGLLSDLTGDQTTKLVARSNAVFKKLENNETIDSDEYAILTLMLTYEKTISLFAVHSDFLQEEPTYLNRHWIMHGRSTHPKGRLDFIKLLHIIYGLLLIKDLSDQDTGV